MNNQDFSSGDDSGKTGTHTGDDVSIRPIEPGVASSNIDPDPMRDDGLAIELSAESSGMGGQPAVVSPVTAAEASAFSLTEAQRTAIVKLTSGSSRVEAAAAAGISRMTLYRWLNHDPAFQCAYNAWQKDVVTTAQGQMLAATRDAMSTVISAIRKGDARLAWKLLESQGITTTPHAGPTDVQELQRREDLEQRKDAIAARKERNELQMDNLMTPDGM